MGAFRTLAVGMAVLASAACGAGSGGAEPATAPAAPVSTSDGPVLPLDRYLLTPAEEARLNHAHRLLIERCVRRYGMTMPAVSTDPLPPGGPNSRRYGVDDPALAAVLGYHVRAARPATGRPATPSAHRSADPALEAVLGGQGRSSVNGHPVPPGGCFGQAQRRLSGGVSAPADMFLAQRLNRDSFGAAQHQPRVRAAIGAWSDCMRAAGFRYADPLRPPADPRFRGAVTARETRTATTDVACKRRTGLVAVWSAVEAQIQRSAVTAHRARLEQIRRVNQAQLAAAASIG